MATPEVVMGSSLLAMFVSLGVDGLLGFLTLVIAHTLFCLSFVVVTVKARLAGMDTRLEQAAMDLYANEWQTFRLVTLPLAMPGIVAAAMLSFSLSFDDFIVSNFTAGQSVTFPLYVYGAKLKEFPPQLFVVGTIMFLVSFVFVIARRGVATAPSGGGPMTATIPHWRSGARWEGSAARFGDVHDPATGEVSRAGGPGQR